MDKIKKTDHFYLIDGSGYIFRAYYALPPLTRKSDGLPTGAVSGFCSMLFKLLEDSKSNQNLQKPTHFAVIFDSARKTFRNEIYSDYKANRSEAPDDLAPQFEYIRKSVLAFNLPSVDLPNYEADDLIATYVDQILKKGAKVTIVSSDKDLMQLYKKGVRIFDPMKNKFISNEDINNKFGVNPEKVIDVQALAGDSSDNVPGVPGIGVKTAAELINALSLFSINVSLLLFCLISLADFSKFSKVPYLLISSAAVLIPIPGTPGTLSLLSPAKDCTSITFDASTPNFFTTSSSVINLFFIGSKIRTPFL